ncbi:MAG: DUF3604 domain-containing protein [Pseudomonadota bacterium]
MKCRMLLAALIVGAYLTACSKLDDPSLQPPFDPAQSSQLPYKSAVDPEPNRQLFFGDLHIHTSLSTDAYVFGVRSLPEDVYTFALGGTIEHGAGYPIKISRPLDFAAATDHAEYMGQARLANLDVPTNQRPLRELLLEGNILKTTIAWARSTGFIADKGFGFGVDYRDAVINKAAWQMTIDAAEKFNSPGVFTSFIAYEWSAFAGSSSVHIHRNIIYRSAKVSELPFSYIDSPQPERLWDFLEREDEAGRTALAIPHNANLSNGLMYGRLDSNGQPLSREYAEKRRRFEPISEILQVKGSSETHPLLSSLDEFADFEIAGLGVNEADGLEGIKGSYARDALRLGLELSHSEGFNPYEFGVIGASDSHNASSPVEENSYHGKLPMMDGSAGLRTDEVTLLPAGLNPVTRWGSGGLAGVWATENTRASLFDAMVRKETFATSGPRITVRFFAGWDYTKHILDSDDLIEQAYKSGVPMGGKLPVNQASKEPTFLVLAMKDPDGANLDRLQIVKAWVNKDGTSREKVFNVAASNERPINQSTGAVDAVGNTVDIENASYANTIGAASLGTVWTDPEFGAEQQAIYYARVLEIPTPRWSTYDAKVLGIDAMEPAWIQERAITSAIWVGTNLTQ